jgi:diguanylate cyclase (GGDEF)-like protein
MDRGEVEQMLSERPIRMLVVDDSEDDAFLLYSELAARGARIDYRRVDDARDMAAALATNEWEVIICDHKMPSFDSFGALEVLKESGKDIPFIIYSGVITDAQAISAMGHGVSDYIQKGNFARLIPVIERELRGAAARNAVRQADHRIKELAFYDSLSNLPNHNLFCARVDDWIAEMGRCGKDPHGALYFIDVDRFMRINSSFGYDVGNEILRQVARRLGESAEHHAIVARLGGDEFGVFYPQLTNADAACAFARWMMQAFDAPFMKGQLELYLTPSIGVTLLPEDGGDVYELLMNAETAMAVVKRSGGNDFRFYTRNLNATAAERLALESDLRHAIERNELFLQFQPVVRALDSTVAGVEALLRWRHPHLGLMLPDRFIPIADESGLIVDVGEWVLRQACVQGQVWHNLGYRNLSVSVNVSAVQFSQPRLLEVVASALADTGFRPQDLELEITESVLMRDAESTIGMLKALKSLGVKISVDDFGTGYSSLSYLRRFPIDILKIDKSFVRDIGSDGEDEAIVRAIMALAKTLRLLTIGEGVESAAQFNYLRREGCDRFQGYYFSRPVDVAGLLMRLTEEKGTAGERFNACPAQDLT